MTGELIFWISAGGFALIALAAMVVAQVRSYADESNRLGAGALAAGAVLVALIIASIAAYQIVDRVMPPQCKCTEATK